MKNIKFVFKFLNVAVWTGVVALSLPLSGRASESEPSKTTMPHSGSQSGKHAAPPHTLDSGIDLKPAAHYHGRTPADLKNGIPFNSGTYGKPNKNYEKWAETPVVVPGMSELNYPYGNKSDFIAACVESADFVENAIRNWKSVSPNKKPEVKEYAEKSIQIMQPLLDRMKSAINASSSSGKGDWEKNQADARRALIEMRGTYSSLHKNVH